MQKRRKRRKKHEIVGNAKDVKGKRIVESATTVRYCTIWCVKKTWKCKDSLSCGSLFYCYFWGKERPNMSLCIFFIVYPQSPRTLLLKVNWTWQITYTQPLTHILGPKNKYLTVKSKTFPVLGKNGIFSLKIL